MRQVDVALIALGGCNVAIASAQAKSSGLAGGVADSLSEQIKAKLKEHHINLMIGNVERDTADAFGKVARKMVLETLATAEGDLAAATLPPRFQNKLDRAKEALSGESSNLEVIAALLTEITYDLIEELKTPMFLRLDSDRRAYYEQRESPFGAEVESVFPDAVKDIAAANRCFALDEWTACIFHAMRVLEHGLRPLAQRFNVDFTVDSWHKVIKGIEDGLTALREKKGLTDQDRKEITYYSDAASQFRYFKDAWRNHVSHAREHYDERDAEKVLTHVREFMQHLTTPI